MADKEGLMFMEDKLVLDTEDKKNELESYIYELRGKIDDTYAEFSIEEERSKLKEKLEQAEDWLYDEGDDATKAVYIAKMDEIRFVAGPIVARYLEKVEEERQAVLKAEEERAAKKREELEARRRAAEEAKKASEPKKEEEPAKAEADTEMKDAETIKPDGVEEP